MCGGHGRRRYCVLAGVAGVLVASAGAVSPTCSKGHASRRWTGSAGSSFGAAGEHDCCSACMCTKALQLWTHSRKRCSAMRVAPIFWGLWSHTAAWGAGPAELKWPLTARIRKLAQVVGQPPLPAGCLETMEVLQWQLEEVQRRLRSCSERAAGC